MLKLAGNQLLKIPTLSITLLMVIIAAVFLGAYSLTTTEVLSAIINNDNPQTSYLVLNIRLPRILLSAITGAGLAISGAAIQGLFRNPLADQTLIGVTSGAMLFAVLSIVLMGSVLAMFTEAIQQASVAIFAFMGGFGTTYLVYFLSRKNGQTIVMTMLLAGIAISAFAAAIAGFFIYLSDDQQLRDITFWSLGSFGGASWLQFWITGPLVIVAIMVLTRYAKALNAILMGEKEAMYLGIPVEKVKSKIIMLTAFIVGICIAMSGIIGFVGLVIPHFLRLLKGTDYKYLLTSSAILGAIFLVLADTIARTVIAPAELPIGIITAFVGAPFFLWLLVKSQREMFLT
ncbi:MAG: iron ABC transporter permease [Bacteroidota bacterium]